MKTLAIILLSLTIFSEVSAVKLRSESSNTHIETIQKLREISKQNPGSEGLISTIEISLSTKNAQVEKIIKFVTDTLDESAKKRDIAVKEQDAELEKKQKKIKKVEKGINEDKASLAETNENIKTTKEKKVKLGRKVASLRKELQDLSRKGRTLKSARQSDMKAFGKRQIRDGAAIKGLAKIIPMLEKLVASKKFIQKTQQEVQKTLAKIPKGNPIASLVELTTTLNPTKVKFVIKKLSGIKNAIIKSKADDAAGEKDAVKKFVALMKQLAKVVRIKSAELKRNTKQLALVESNLEDLEEKRANLKTSIKKDTKILASKKEAKQAAANLWKNKISDLQGTIKSLKAALKILKEGKKVLTKMADTAGAVF